MLTISQSTKAEFIKVSWETHTLQRWDEVTVKIEPIFIVLLVRFRAIMFVRSYPALLGMFIVHRHNRILYWNTEANIYEGLNFGVSRRMMHFCCKHIYTLLSNILISYRALLVKPTTFGYGRVLLTKYNIRDAFHFIGEKYVSKYTSV